MAEPERMFNKSAALPSELGAGRSRGDINSNSSSTERRPGEYFLFALAFVAFLVAAGGVVLSSLPMAAFGGVLLLLCLLGFRARPGSGE